MRKRKLSREEILGVALRLVDEEGLERCSMRRLAERLDVKAMSLYNYVSNKGELLDGLYEKVLEEMEVPEVTGDWVEDLRALACAFREVLCKHPRVLPLFATRPAFSEGSLAYMDAVFGILEGPFAAPLTRLYVFQVLVTFVLGNTMYQHGSLLGGDVPQGEVGYEGFAKLAQVGQALTEYDAQEEFAFGLELLLRGLEQRAGGFVSSHDLRKC